MKSLPRPFRLGALVLLALLLIAGSAIAPRFLHAQFFNLGQPAPAALIDVLDIGQGDAILIRSPEGKIALVDAGPDSSVVERIQALGVKHIDLVVVTHHHTDHYGGMDDVIRTFSPKYYVATESSHTTSRYLALLKDVKAHNMTMIVPGPKGRRITLGSVILYVLPQPPEHKEENNNSIGIRVEHGRSTFLLTGDSEEDERDWWMQNCPDLLRNCQILKLAHHGSHNGTDTRWLDLVKPQLAVASLAKGNDYGHPHKEALEMLATARIPLLRTDERGTITFRSTGKGWLPDSPELAANLTPSPRSGLFAPNNPNARRFSLGSLFDMPASKPTAPPETDPAPRLVNLNKASVDELKRVPGITSSAARKIVEQRPYKSMKDLQKIEGLSPTQLAELEDHATLR